MIRKAHFAWAPTKSALKSGQNYLHLQPEVIPQNGYSVRLKVDTERELQHSQDLGWNWHKSWNLPNISVKLELLRDDQSEDAHWPFCSVRLNAVKQLSDDLYEEVGLEGTTKQEMTEGKAFFSGVKFNSTTYNHQGHRFNLLLTLLHGEKVVVALISPQIFVDSRKSARDEHRQFQYIQLFDKRALERSFCKKEKHFNDVVDAPIENNENGLHNYLTAPNIRNKIKHPIFLVLKFSKCLQLHFRKDEQTEALSTGEHIVRFQNQLVKKEETDYVISYQLNNNRTKRKIEESLATLFVQNKIRVFERKLTDEAKFQKLEICEDDYGLVYPQLVEIMSHYGEYNQEGNEYSQPEPMVLKKARLDFEKLPTKTFDEINPEKQVKVEEENQSPGHHSQASEFLQQHQQFQQQQLKIIQNQQQQHQQQQQQQSQFFQQQIFNYIMLQQQLMMRLLMQSH